MNSQLPSAGSSNQPALVRRLSLLPLGCLFRVSPFFLFGLVALAIAVGYYAFMNLNMEFLGIGKPQFANYQFSPGFMRIDDSSKRHWEISYEKKTSSTFAGLVRHISPIRLNDIPFLTHDILITSGDFANPELVSTSAVNHHFSWFSFSKNHPNGTINLIHALPKDETIYRQLLEIRSGDQVTLSGWEILRIDAFDSRNINLMWWQDAGCNTMLVDSVTISK
jgi:hypothetical protein